MSYQIQNGKTCAFSGWLNFGVHKWLNLGVPHGYGHPQKVHGPRIAPMPVRVIPQSMVGPGFLAHMLVGKYMDHIPYYRQQRID